MLVWWWWASVSFYAPRPVHRGNLVLYQTVPSSQTWGYGTVKCNKHAAERGTHAGEQLATSNKMYRRMVNWHALILPCTRHMRWCHLLDSLGWTSGCALGAQPEPKVTVQQNATSTAYRCENITIKSDKACTSAVQQQHGEGALSVLCTEGCGCGGLSCRIGFRKCSTGSQADAGQVLVGAGSVSSCAPLWSL